MLQDLGYRKPGGFDLVRDGRNWPIGRSGDDPGLLLIVWHGIISEGKCSAGNDLPALRGETALRCLHEAGADI
jgi:hypothetical protein